ncbi:MAG: hypothetical protein HYW91_01300 [Candidatus Sungbacteria bacterium]|nr:hypothetical protein [Candidatus Sungbacteria bacterium]
MTKFSAKFFIMVSVVVAASFVAGAYAFGAYNIEKAKRLKYPIGELGNCQSFEECKVYCNKDENIPKCNRFSIKSGLLTQEEAADTERMLSLMEESGLPGKCQGAVECFSYCESAAHIDECWNYAERHNLTHGYDVETIRRLAKFAREGGKFPGNCKEGAECETYCGDISHFAECADFGEKVGLMTKEETDVMRKIARSGVTQTPGNCQKKEQCESYCMDSAHIDECLAFAEKTGLLPPEELADAKKFAPLIKSGETPGGCQRKNECETYCNDAAHFEECVAFAEKAGMISKEDAELARRTKGTGPGGCKSKAECEAFCRLPANQATCISFAREHGFTEEAGEIEAKVRGEAEGKMMACADKPCSEFIACLSSLQSGEGGEEKLPLDLKTKLNSCIEEIKAEAVKGAGGLERVVPEEGRVPSPQPQVPQQQEQLGKEGQKQYEEQYKKQYEEEYKKQYEEQVKSQVDCSLFAAAPTCDYAGAPGSQNYNYCKQCYPDK